MSQQFAELFIEYIKQKQEEEQWYEENKGYYIEPKSIIPVIYSGSLFPELNSNDEESPYSHDD